MGNNVEKKGYWIYSIIAIIIGFGLFAFWGYLIYDLIIKLSEKEMIQHKKHMSQLYKNY